MTTLKYSDKEIIFQTKNCAILGANGKGKSSLSKKISSGDPSVKIHLISAQRNLSINQGKHKATKDDELTVRQTTFIRSDGGVLDIPTDNNFIQSDFDQNLEKIIRDDINLHANASRNHISTAVYIKPETKANDVFKIWNKIFLDKSIYINENGKIYVSGINLQDASNQPYEIENLSDGERSALYLITKCLYAPKKSMVIVDEAETHLNQSLLQDLWDEIEGFRSDCSFLYISHNIEFVTSRRDCSNFWIKSFEYPESWVVEEIKEDVLPEDLIIQIIGTKKNKILFVESKDSTNLSDKKLYQKIYPDFKVLSVNSCADVEKFTKALNKSNENYSKEYFGLIDRDYKTDEDIARLESEKVFTIPTAEFEGLFYLEEVVRKYLEINSVEAVENKIELLKSDLIKLSNSYDYKNTFYKTMIRKDFYDKNSNLKGYEEFSVFNFTPDISGIDSKFQLRNSDNTSINNMLKCINTKAVKNIKVNDKNASEYQLLIIDLLSKNDVFKEEFKKVLPKIN